MLALSDALLVATTVLCVPFAKAISKGWVNYYWTGAILQHIFQACVLLVSVTWTFHRYVPPHTIISTTENPRQWPWVQSGFLTLHSFVRKLSSHLAVLLTTGTGHDYEDALLPLRQRLPSVDFQTF